MKIDKKFVEACLELSDNEHSKLTEREKNIFGLSSNRQRDLVNNLCSIPDAKYLELGVYKGATLLSAASGNKVSEIVGVDNYSYDEREPRKKAPEGKIWDNMKSHLADNISKYLDVDSTVDTKKIRIIEEDWKQVDWSNESGFNVCLFDITPTTAEDYDFFFKNVYQAMDKHCVVVFTNYSNEDKCVHIDEALLANKDLFYETSRNVRISGSLSDSTHYYSGVLVVTLQRKSKVDNAEKNSN